MKNENYVQIYLSNVPGTTNIEKVRNWFAQYDALTTLQKNSIGGILPHTFYQHFSKIDFSEWVSAARARGLDVGLAWGVGDTSNPRAHGEFYGEFAAHPDCVGTLIDIETHAWEGPGAAAAAKELCEGFRSKAPRAVFCCQTWHVPTLHSVPYATFEQYCDFFSSMDYVNEAGFVSQYGRNRYWVLSGWFAQSWGQLQREVLAPKRNNRAVPPRSITYQSYGWDDIITSLVSALVNASSMPCILWQQNNATANPRWWIPTATLTALARQARLKELGYSGLDAIWNFQRRQPQLVVDGLCGPATAAALGVP